MRVLPRTPRALCGAERMELTEDRDVEASSPVRHIRDGGDEHAVRPEHTSQLAHRLHREEQVLEHLHTDDRVERRVRKRECRELVDLLCRQSSSTRPLDRSRADIDPGVTTGHAREPGAVRAAVAATGIEDRGTTHVLLEDVSQATREPRADPVFRLPVRVVVGLHAGRIVRPAKGPRTLGPRCRRGSPEHAQALRRRVLREADHLERTEAVRIEERVDRRAPARRA